MVLNGAGTRNRTTDFHITNVALYQLSYTGFEQIIRHVAIATSGGARV